MLILFTLWLAGAESGRLIVAPAPGSQFTLPARVQTPAGSVALDAKGEGILMKGSRPEIPGFRTIVVSRKDGPGKILYFPASCSVVQWPISSDAVSGELLVKKHDERWSAAVASSVEVESPNRRSSVRFVLAPGHWDVAVILPRLAPLFRFDLVGDGTERALTRQESTPAGRVTARVKDARTGIVPPHWRAHAREINADLDPAMRTFFDQRAIATDARSLEYSSLPAGSWEILVEATGQGRRRATLSISPPFPPVDLGDIFLTGGGNLKAVLSFPGELPRGALLVSAYRDRPGSLLGAPELLGSRTVRAAPQASVELTELEPGRIRLVCESAIDGLYRQEDGIIVAGKLLTMALTFIPTNVEGEVWRGKTAIEGATVSLEHDRHRVASVSDSNGKYAVRVWSPGDYQISAQPTDGGLYTQVVLVPPETATVTYDIALPPNAVTGTVRDADTGEPVAKARIAFTNTERVRGRTAVNFHYTRYAGPDGVYRLDNLDPRSIDLSISAPGYAPAEFSAVMPSEEGTSLDITLSKAGVLRGQVVDETGTPVTGAFVGLDGARSGFRMQTNTAGNGDFEFRDVGSGPHTLVAHKCGYRIGILTLTSTTEPQPLTLAHTIGGVTLHFEDTVGNPLPRVAINVAARAIALPEEYPSRFAIQCGTRAFSDGEGNLQYDFLPEGPISLFAEPHHEFLGTYVNDGIQRIWRIPFPTAAGSK